MTISWDRSLTLARQQTGVSELKEVANWFSYAKDSCDTNELKAQARKLIAKTLRDEYEDFENWYGEWFYVPLPSLKYVNRGFPFIEFNVDLYIAASVHVCVDYCNEQQAEFVKPLKKGIEKLRIPVMFLDAIAKGDLRRLSQFKVAERDCHYITLDIPGFGETRLRDSLIPCWRNFFKGKRVGQVLSQAGLLTQDAGGIIDACLERSTGVPQLPSGGYEDLVDGLFSLGWNKTQAQERAKYVMEKYPSASLEERIKYALSS
jgi:hypothetical protein